MITGSTPILASTDILATVAFYKEVIGFPQSWTWGDPPTVAGASWGSVSLMFSLNLDLAARIEGQELWIDVEDVDGLYSRHLEKGAAVVSPIEDKPWNRREYTVRDPSGYLLRFGAPPGYVSKGSGEFPDGMRFVRQVPTLEDHERVTDAAFGTKSQAKAPLERAWGGVVAISPAGEVVGVLRIMFDAPGWFSVWDVAVLPDWQGRRIGSLMMEEALEAVRQESPGAFVYLFTFKGAFYERLGFDKKSLHIRTV